MARMLLVLFVVMWCSGCSREIVRQDEPTAWALRRQLVREVALDRFRAALGGLSSESSKGWRDW